MKGYVCLFLLSVATVAFALSKGSSDEAAVLSVQQQWLEASQKGDTEALRQIIDDNFVGSTPNNQIINKQSLLPPRGNEPIFAKTQFEGLNATVIGDTAVVFGTMITTGDTTALRCAMVYGKRAGTWKMIAAQLVPVSETKDGGS
ncbi:MAG TPA: nuclear transport factor 2 family protein [Candidatus Sulfotelmatobacter sp.]|nr:nuclear transport factor 2 family protein [Candidatus Sulfotelmatobacter sp.]